MRIDILTLFPDMINAYTGESIIKRAIEKQKLSIFAHNIRDYTLNRQKQVDDAPYGGGHGMIMNAQPIHDCFLEICKMTEKRPHLIFVTPVGNVVDQQKINQLAKLENIAILCGHYEGVDQRVVDEIVDEELSLGDFVITGGELAALVIADAVARQCEGVLSEAVGFEQESHFGGLLEHPQYTRPEIWNDRAVPKILLSGHHANIEKWKHEMSLEITKQKRPDMYEKYITDLNGENKK